MGYPTAAPAAKHDLLCPGAVLDALRRPRGDAGGGVAGLDVLASMDDLAAALAGSATARPGEVRYSKLATVYTYPDAPRTPKPLSCAPRVCRLARRDLFDRCCSATGAANKRCAIAVKLPERIVPPTDAKARQNSRKFRDFARFLREKRVVAVLACDSAGRIGFVVPNDGDGNNADGHAAWLHYAPLKEFLARSQARGAAGAAALATKRKSPPEADGGEPETWTPPYTPPPEEECQPRGWDDRDDAAGGEPDTWTPPYTPPPEEECGPRGWDDGGQGHDVAAGLFVPPGASSAAGDGGLFVPPGAEKQEDGLGSGLWGWDNNKQNDSTCNNDNSGGWDTATSADSGGWNATSAWGNTDADDNGNQIDHTGLGGWSTVAADAAESKPMDTGTFHANVGAAAADAFYSGLTRSLGTRADSLLYHMRSFNGWVKATQIAELDPDTSRAAAGNGKKRSRSSPLRVLDLACGKGGDLGKWALHQRRLENYVGVDVARGSLVDAAIRARQMSKRGASSLRRCTFTLADLGEDVPGRRRSAGETTLQKLLTWNLQEETEEDKKRDPVFAAAEGGGIAETDKFDVVSIQFAIHYMMSSRQRARRFFRTVSSLLEVGGNLIATTIDARVVVERLLGLGLDLHFDGVDRHPDVDGTEATATAEGDEGPGGTVSVGGGACRLKFGAETLKKIFQPPKSPEDVFGLQYSFLLTEGSDHASGVGEAVDLPEWLTPVPVLEELAEEGGLRLEYVSCVFVLSFFSSKRPASYSARLGYQLSRVLRGEKKTNEISNGS